MSAKVTDTNRWSIAACVSAAALLCGCGPSEYVKPADLTKELSITVKAAPLGQDGRGENMFSVSARISEIAQRSTKTKGGYTQSFAFSAVPFPELTGNVGKDVRIAMTKRQPEPESLLIETPAGEIIIGKLLIGALLRVEITSYDTITKQGTLTVECMRADPGDVFYLSDEDVAFTLNEPVVLKEHTHRPARTEEPSPEY